jgi:hypothetical protein
MIKKQYLEKVIQVIANTSLIMTSITVIRAVAKASSSWLIKEYDI